MSVSIENVSFKTVDNCSFAEVNRNVNEHVRQSERRFESAEIIRGASEVSTTTMNTIQHDGSEGNSSRVLAEGELATRTLTGGPVDVRTADHSKVVVEYQGMTVQLSELEKLGFVEVKDGLVKAQALPNAAPAAPVAKPLDLGPEWGMLRRANPSADTLLASVISAVSEGKEGPALSHKLASWNESMKFGFSDEAEIVSAYNAALGLVHESIQKEWVRSDPRVRADEAADVLEVLLAEMNPSDRSNLMLRAIMGDRSYLGQLNRMLNKKIRAVEDERKQGK